MVKDGHQVAGASDPQGSVLHPFHLEPDPSLLSDVLFSVYQEKVMA